MNTQTPGDHLFCATRTNLYHSPIKTQSKKPIAKKTPYVQSNQSSRAWKIIRQRT
jgi:hypothetical protein